MLMNYMFFLLTGMYMHDACMCSTNKALVHFTLKEALFNMIL